MEKQQKILDKKKKNCPITMTSQLIGDMWVILIVKHLLDGPKRFNSLQELMFQTDFPHKISPKTLSQRLKMLEETDVIIRKVFAEVPIHVEYSLTPKGKALSSILDKMKDYGDKYLCK